MSKNFQDKILFYTLLKGQAFTINTSKLDILKVCEAASTDRYVTLTFVDRQSITVHVDPWWSAVRWPRRWRSGGYRKGVPVRPPWAAIPATVAAAPCRPPTAPTAAVTVPPVSSWRYLLGTEPFSTLSRLVLALQEWYPFVSGGEWFNLSKSFY